MTFEIEVQALRDELQRSKKETATLREEVRTLTRANQAMGRRESFDPTYRDSGAARTFHPLPADKDMSDL